MDDESRKTEVPKELGNEIGGNGRVYFDNVVIDNMLDALLELSATVWTHHDRVIVLEKILAAKGIDVSEEIEAHLPDEAEIAARTAERDAFVERIFGAFLRRPTSDLADKVKI
ncbi:hypothetical protein [Parasphingorhabdus sp.]|jgi:hypothetical protein|uniref:hypothetical protein n=1 Tax=Parasphingorhabdus sp. TaxID=2709688 RepID=UPI003BB0BE98